MSGLRILTRVWPAAFAGVILMTAVAAPAAADKLDDIKARGKLLVGVTESSPPFSFLEPGKGISRL